MERGSGGLLECGEGYHGVVMFLVVVALLRFNEQFRHILVPRFESMLVLCGGSENTVLGSVSGPLRHM